MKRHRHVIGLGANQGAPLAAIRIAVDALRGDGELAVVACSPIYCSEPVGPPQADFFNGAVLVEGALEPAALLSRLHGIEAALGRTRDVRWGPRTLDLDILWSDVVVAEPALTVPHARLLERWWALQPLLDVLPELGSRYGTHARRLHLPRPPAFAFEGVNGAGLTRLSSGVDGTQRVSVALGEFGIGRLDGLVLALRALPGFDRCTSGRQAQRSAHTFADLRACADGLLALSDGEHRLLDAHLDTASPGVGATVWTARAPSRRQRLLALQVTQERLSLEVTEGQ